MPAIQHHVLDLWHVINMRNFNVPDDWHADFVTPTFKKGLVIEK